MKWRIIVLIGAMSYGILSTIVKLAYQDGFNVAQVVTSQLWLGALICWLIALFMTIIRIPMSLQKGKWWKIIISGFPLGITSFAYYKCVENIPVSIAIVLLFQFVWIGMIFDYIGKKKIPNSTQILSTIALLSGTVMAAGLIGKTHFEWHLPGIGYGLLAATSYAAFIYVNGLDQGRSHFIITAALRASGGAIFSILFFNPFDGLAHLFTNGLLTYGIPLAIFGVSVPPILFAWGVPKIGTTESAILSGVELPVAVLSAWFVLHEHVYITQWIGILIILTAIILPQINTLRGHPKKG